MNHCIKSGDKYFQALPKLHFQNGTKRKSSDGESEDENGESEDEVISAGKGPEGREERALMRAADREFSPDSPVPNQFDDLNEQYKTIMRKPPPSGSKSKKVQKTKRSREHSDSVDCNC